MHNYQKWETQDGRILELSEMNEVHIQNCINMLIRQIEAIQDGLFSGDIELSLDVEAAVIHKRKYIQSFEKELRKRVDKTNAVCYNNYSKKNNSNIQSQGGNYMDSMNGSIGGFMVKKMIEAQERAMQNGVTTTSNTNQTNKKGDNVMKSTGIVRRIDDLGRVVIPREVRRQLGFREGDPLELFISDKGLELRKDMTAERKQTASRILREMPRNIDFIRNGNAIICFTKERNGEGFKAKTGVAMCSPSDEWNEDVGRAIAYLRMMGKNVPEVLIS